MLLRLLEVLLFVLGSSLQVGRDEEGRCSLNEFLLLNHHFYFRSYNSPCSQTPPQHPAHLVDAEPGRGDVVGGGGAGELSRVPLDLLAALEPLCTF